MRWRDAVLVASALALLVLLAVSAASASTQSPMCAVFNGVRVGPDRVPAVLFMCNDEPGPTFRVVSEAFYRQFSDALEPLWVRKNLIQ